MSAALSLPSSGVVAQRPSRTKLYLLIGLMTASSDLAFAQMKPSPKAAPGANEVRYFTSIDGLMDGNADVVLKETRQGKNVTSAVLDIYPPSERKGFFGRAAWQIANDHQLFVEYHLSKTEVTYASSETPVNIGSFGDRFHPRQDLRPCDHRTRRTPGMPSDNV